HLLHIPLLLSPCTRTIHHSHLHSFPTRRSSDLAEQLRHLFSGQMYNLNPFNILLTPVCKYTFSIKWDNSFYLSKEEMIRPNQQEFNTISTTFEASVSII